MILSELFSSILQLIVFSLIPLSVYLIQNRKFAGFRQYIGLYGTTRPAIGWSLLVALLFLAGGVGLAALNADLLAVMHNPQTMTGKFREMGPGPTAYLLILLTAWIKTSLAEEIFFRGFLAKRLMNSLGYLRGNVLQAIIFGLVHLLLFWVLIPAEPFALAFIFAFSTTAGFLIGWIKEKVGNGSIVPGWIAHGLGNTISYTIVGFLL